MHTLNGSTPLTLRRPIDAPGQAPDAQPDTPALKRRAFAPGGTSPPARREAADPPGRATESRAKDPPEGRRAASFNGSALPPRKAVIDLPGRAPESAPHAPSQGKARRVTFDETRNTTHEFEIEAGNKLSPSPGKSRVAPQAAKSAARARTPEPEGEYHFLPPKSDGLLSRLATALNPWRES
jgi:hypothetical protein